MEKLTLAQCILEFKVKMTRESSNAIDDYLPYISINVCKYCELEYLDKVAREEATYHRLAPPYGVLVVYGVPLAPVAPEGCFYCRGEKGVSYGR